MVLMAVFTTFITTPVVMAVYKPAKQMGKGNYKHRTIEREDKDSQLRIMMCFHSTRNIPTIINLIEASRGTEKREGLCVYAMHLMGLSERPSAILMVHKSRKNGLPFWNKMQQPHSSLVVVAFEAFRQLSRVAVKPMTVISHMSNIHDDICASAERKRVAMIILPFHKHQRLDGSLETTRNEFRWVNKRVLEHAQCSVGILVDRGLGGSTHVSASNVSSSTTVLFFGGPDDREALAYGVRMAEHPGISLTIIHLLADPETAPEITRVDANGSSYASMTSADEKFLGEIQQASTCDSTIIYEKRLVKNSEGVIAVVREFSSCNLFLVGRSSGGDLVANLNKKIECPELGPMGSMLISPDFPISASVLVVQKYSDGMSSTKNITEVAKEDIESK